MPNVQVSIYLTDEDFARYIKDKVHINNTTRAAFKRAVDRVK